MIQLQNISLQYPNGKIALDRINCTINPGEFVVVTGNTGAGKSALLKVIAMIERPTSGILSINGKEVSALKPSKIPYFRRSIGLVFQDQKLLAHRSVLDNLVFPLEMIGYSEKEACSRARAALERVNLQHKADQYPVDLSGGERQCLCVARAIINKPAIVLADEPFFNLDMANARKILSMFKMISRVGVTVIIATHFSSMLNNIQGRLIRLDAGIMVE